MKLFEPSTVLRHSVFCIFTSAYVFIIFSLFFVIFYYLHNMMSHDLHDNILRKCLEIEMVQSNFHLGPRLWRTKPDLFCPGWWT